jgi:hypothetical protein
MNTLYNYLIHYTNLVKHLRTITKILLFILMIIIGIILYMYNKYYFDFNGVYEEDVYPSKEFNEIKRMCEQIIDKKLYLDPKASGRLMYTFSKKDPIISKINSCLFTEKVRTLTGNYKLVFCPDIPVEYRKYVVGSYMDWHTDTIMLNNQLQYECVITISNTSDSETLLDKKIYTSHIETEPNSLLIVRANGVRHKVTELTKGERTIIKLVFYDPNISIDKV